MDFRFKKTKPVTMTAAEVVASMTISDVLEFVEDGEMTAEEAMTAERAGKNRVTLIKALSEL